MATQRTMPGSALLTAGLLSAVVALIAGILGMHVMTGTHSMHALTAVTGTPSAAVGSVSTTTDRESTGHSGHAGASQERAASRDAAASGMSASPAQCSCSGNCTNQHAMSASCIPSVAPGGLSAPAPNDTPSITAPSQTSTIIARRVWAYRLGSPSPAELSSSRT